MTLKNVVCVKRCQWKREGSVRGAGRAPGAGWPAPDRCVVLGLRDVPRLRALRTVDDLELDRLTLFQGPETVATDRGVVDEHVAATLALNETVALGVVEPLDLACDTHRSSSCLLGTRWYSASARGRVSGGPQMRYRRQKKTASACAASTAACWGTPSTQPYPTRQATKVSRSSRLEMSHF